MSQGEPIPTLLGTALLVPSGGRGSVRRERPSCRADNTTLGLRVSRGVTLPRPRPRTRRVE